MSSERKLRLMSWNSNGLKSKKEKVESEIKKQNCDVVFLQQTRSGESEVLEELEDYKAFYTTHTSNSTGVAILIKTDIYEETGICTTEKDHTGCYIVVKCILKEQLFTLLSVYNCLTDTKPLIKLRSVLEKHAEGILLIGGDFNVALNPYLDRTSTTMNPNHIHFRPVVEELMTSFHLVDVWRRLHPTDRKYSHQQNSKAGLVISRLDYIFVPEESMPFIECDISQDECCSDHYPVVYQINLPNEESNTPEVALVRSNKKRTMHILRFQETVVDKWLRYKCKYWPNTDLTVDASTPLMISDSEVVRAIQSLVLNHVKRPDGLSLSFYKRNSHVLIPHLCAFYHNVLEQPTNIPEMFSESYKVSETHHIFNVDYLILATIMSRWLNDHLQSHSTDYTDEENTKTVLFTLKKQLFVVEWPLLNTLLHKEQDKDKTDPPLPDKFKTEVLRKILTDSSNEDKLLHWGCPLTPVLMSLYLKHVASEAIEDVEDRRAYIYISRENVIVKEPDLHILKNLKERYRLVDCTILQ